MFCRPDVVQLFDFRVTSHSNGMHDVPAAGRPAAWKPQSRKGEPPMACGELSRESAKGCLATGPDPGG
jgi:hypothetical protein